MSRTAVIVGAGLTDVGKVYGPSARSLAAEAVRLAVEDAGLTLGQVDGLLINAGKSGGLDLSLARHLGPQNLRLLLEVNAFGASAAIMVAQAATAVVSGAAEVVACVFADTPRREGAASGEVYRQSSLEAAGFRSAETAAGFRSVNHRYALAASRYMSTFGVDQGHRGAAAVSQRAWAASNPVAQMRTPLTPEDYHAPPGSSNRCTCSTAAWSPMAAPPSSSSPRSAAGLRQPPLRVLSWGQAHPGYVLERGRATSTSRTGLRTWSSPAARTSTPQRWNAY